MMTIYTQLQVVECQLNTAIELFLNNHDLVCPITLAGASEEILGKSLKEKGKANAVEQEADALIQFKQIRDGALSNRKHFISKVNEVRDFLKHFKGDEAIEILEFMTIDMIFRAVGNYYQFTGMLTLTMQRFINECLVKNELRRSPFNPSQQGSTQP